MEMNVTENAKYCNGCKHEPLTEKDFPCSICELGTKWESSNAEKLSAYPIEILIPVTLVIGITIGFIGGYVLGVLI